MNRNMMRRVELAWPVNDPALRQQIIDECLVAYLHDDRDAWTQAAKPGRPQKGRLLTQHTGLPPRVTGSGKPSFKAAARKPR